VATAGVAVVNPASSFETRRWLVMPDVAALDAVELCVVDLWPLLPQPATSTATSTPQRVARLPPMTRSYARSD
jgi:hypothetical protein